MTSLETEVPVRRLLALLAIVLLGGCAAAADLPPDQAATVNGAVIPVSQVATQVDSAKAQLARQQQAGDALNGGQLTRQALGQLIQTQIVLDGARNEGVTVQDAAVLERIDAIRTQAESSGASLDDFLASQGLTQAQLRERVRVDLTITAVAEQLVPGPNAADLQAELERRRAEFLRVEARHILVADEATAKQVRAQLAAGGDWNALAQQFSTDTGSKAKGGSLGAIAKGQTVAPFDTAAFALAGEGDCRGKLGPCTSPLSAPVKTEFGWHVIQVTGTSLPTVDQAREQLEDPGLQQRRQEAVQGWYKELAVGADVRVNPRFGHWDADQGRIAERDTAPRPPDSTGPLAPAPTPEGEPDTTAP
jgi:parvulin-like peptidyl-prolyl isomerase